MKDPLVRELEAERRCVERAAAFLGVEERLLWHALYRGDELAICSGCHERLVLVRQQTRCEACSGEAKLVLLPEPALPPAKRGRPRKLLPEDEIQFGHVIRRFDIRREGATVAIESENYGTYTRRLVDAGLFLAEPDKAVVWLTLTKAGASKAKRLEEKSTSKKKPAKRGAR